MAKTSETKAKKASEVAISLDAWAVLLAHVEHFPKERRDEVLERLGQDPADWLKLEREGNAGLFAAIDARQGDRVVAFGARMAETKAKLDAEKTRVEDLGPRRKARTQPMVTRPRRSLRPPPAPPAPSGPVAPPVPPPAAAPSVFLPQPGRAHPCLSLHQYASLRAETASAPDEAAVAAIRASYGLDDEGDAAEAAAWGQKFKQGRTFDEYQKLFQYFRATAARRP